MFGLFSNKKTQQNAFGTYAAVSKRHFNYQPQPQVEIETIRVVARLDVHTDEVTPVTPQRDVELYNLCAAYMAAVEAKRGVPLKALELHVAENPDAPRSVTCAELATQDRNPADVLQQQILNFLAERGCQLYYDIQIG